MRSCVHLQQSRQMTKLMYPATSWFCNKEQRLMMMGCSSGWCVIGSRMARWVGNDPIRIDMVLLPTTVDKARQTQIESSCQDWDISFSTNFDGRDLRVKVPDAICTSTFEWQKKDTSILRFVLSDKIHRALISKKGMLLVPKCLVMIIRRVWLLLHRHSWHVNGTLILPSSVELIPPFFLPIGLSISWLHLRDQVIHLRLSCLVDLSLTQT